MSQADRERWEARYADPGTDLHKGPSGLLKRHAPPAAPGIRALELACGLGHNALWLAERGYIVDALDISYRALQMARTAMQQRGLAGVNFIVADLDCFPLPHYAYDLVYVFRFLDRRLFPAIRARVRPGGMVIYQTLNIRWADNHTPTHTGHMLELGELPRFFPGWTVLEASDEGRYSTFVGVKP
ncbi:MAG: class I SAM-dependent methyltransferase [Anaerolineae bacterium]|nr:class I SAM-dependent methyltransferase [Anaerolineae bacterium]